MTEPKLKSGVWVKAQIRLCDQRCLPAMVRRKGDADAGVVVLVLDRLDGTAEVFAQARGVDGRLGWVRGAGTGPVASAEVDAYIQEQLRYDPDLWVLDIEDPDRRYELDGDLVA